MKQQKILKPIRLILPLLLFFITTSNCQEKPAFEAVYKETVVNHRQKFCDRHEAVENDRIKLRYALKDLNISVAFFKYMIDEEIGAIDENNPSISFAILDEIARRAGFTYRNTYGLLNTPSGNTTWTDVQEWAVDTYDMMGEWYIENTDRLSRGILFPEGWYNGNLILIQQTNPNEDRRFKLHAFLDPFTPAVWGLMVITTIFSGIVYYVLDYFDSRIKKKKMDISLEESLFYTAFSFNGHYVHQPKSRGTRILVFSMAFFYLLIVAAYTANLASFLVSKNQPKVVINDIQDGIRNDLTFCVWKNTAMDEYLRSFQIPQYRLIREENQGDEYRALIEGRCQILLTTFSEWEVNRRDAKYNPNCYLDFIGRIIKFESAGYSMRDSKEYCTSLLRNALDLHITEMKNDDTLQNIWNRHLDRGATNNCVEEIGGKKDENFERMNVANVSGMFAIHLFSLVVALAMTLFQVCQQPQHRKREMFEEFRSALKGATSLTKAASVGRFKKSTYVNKNVESKPNTAISNYGCEEGREYIVGDAGEDDVDEYYGPSDYSASGVDRSTPFFRKGNIQFAKLDDTVKHILDEIEETKKQYQEELKKQDQKHTEMIEKICKDHRDEMSKKDKQCKEFLETICAQYRDKMSEKDRQHKEYMTMIIETLQKEK